MATKRRELTDEERAECGRLKVIFEKRKAEAKAQGRRLTQADVGDECGWQSGQSAMNQYVNAKVPLNVEALLKLSSVLKFEPSEVSPRLADDIQRIARSASIKNNNDKESNVIAADFSKKARDGEIDIPHYDVRAAMGAGQVLPSDYIETIRHVTVSLEFLRAQGVSYTQRANLAMITGFGESMNKTFTSGDPLIIDKGVTSVVTDGVYLFTLSGALFVKRLQILPNGIRVISDNEAFPPYEITGNDLKTLTVHARVLLAWRSQRL